MKDLTTVQPYLSPSGHVIITIFCGKLHAIVIVEPVSSSAVVSTHLKSVVVTSTFDVETAKVNTKSTFYCQAASKFLNLCVCVVQLQHLFLLISQDAWVNFSTNSRLSAVYILDVTVYLVNLDILS